MSEKSGTGVLDDMLGMTDALDRGEDYNGEFFKITSKESPSTEWSTPGTTIKRISVWRKIREFFGYKEQAFAGTPWKPKGTMVGISIPKIDSYINDKNTEFDKFDMRDGGRSMLKKDSKGMWSGPYYEEMKLQAMKELGQEDKGD